MSATIPAAGSAPAPVAGAVTPASSATAQSTVGPSAAGDQQWQIAHQENTVRWLAIGTTVGFFALIAFLVVLSFHQNTKIGDDPGYKGIIQTLAGVVGTGWAGIISFYFGSSVGARQQSQTINSALQTSIKNQASGDDGSPPDPAQLAQKVTAIVSLADAARTKLASLGDPSVDNMAAEVAAFAGGAPAAATAALDQARRDFQVMTAKVAACATHADGARAALADVQAAGGDASKLAAAADRVRQLDLDSAAANHDFATALADFIDTRARLLKLVAQG